MTSDSIDPLQFIPTLGVIIGMMVGLIGIYNSIKTRQRETKKDIETSIVLSENRLKEFLNLKIQVIENKTDQSYLYFREWIQRIEMEIKK